MFVNKYRPQYCEHIDMYIHVHTHTHAYVTTVLEIDTIGTYNVIKAVYNQCFKVRKWIVYVFVQIDKGYIQRERIACMYVLINFFSHRNMEAPLSTYQQLCTTVGLSFR